MAACMHATCATANVVHRDLELGNRASGSRDLLDRRRRERVRGHAEPADRLAGAENLHKLATPYGTTCRQVSRRHVAASWVERRQPVQVDHLIGDLEP